MKKWAMWGTRRSAGSAAELATQSEGDRNRECTDAAHQPARSTHVDGRTQRPFATDWSGQHTSALRQVIQALREPRPRHSRTPTSKSRSATRTDVGGGAGIRKSPATQPASEPLEQGNDHDGVWGDVAELRQLGAQFERLAGQLDADRMAVGNAIQISAWVAPFASKFRVEWNSDHCVAFTTLRNSCELKPCAPMQRTKTGRVPLQG